MKLEVQSLNLWGILYDRPTYFYSIFQWFKNYVLIVLRMSDPLKSKEKSILLILLFYFLFLLLTFRRV